MTKHVFLTGEIGIGKSTALRRFYELSGLSYDGIITKFDRRQGDRVLSLKHAVPGTAENDWETAVAAEIVNDTKTVHYEAFEVFGAKALHASGKHDAIIMDELGIMEENCGEFKHAVFERLSGDIPVLGVLKKVESQFLGSIAALPNVRVIEVTKENRGSIPAMLMQLVPDTRLFK